MEENKVQVVQGGLQKQEVVEIEHKIAGLEKIGEAGERFLKKVHKNRMQHCGLEMQKELAYENITKVKFNKREKCLQVYFKNGEWSKYFLDGTWG